MLDGQKTDEDEEDDDEEGKNVVTKPPEPPTEDELKSLSIPSGYHNGAHFNSRLVKSLKSDNFKLTYCSIKEDGHLHMRVGLPMGLSVSDAQSALPILKAKWVSFDELLSPPTFIPHV